MASLPSQKEAQPGDGAWLLQNAVPLPPKKRRARKGRNPETFLARRDSVVDSEFKQRETSEATCSKHGPSPVNNANLTIGNSGKPLLSSGSAASHRHPQSTAPHHKFAAQRGLQLQLQLPSFLRTPPPPQLLPPRNAAPCTPLPATLSEHILPVTARMAPGKAIPPHVRMKKAAAPAAVASLPPSPPTTNGSPSKHVSVGVNPDTETVVDWTKWSMDDKSPDSTLLNPESLKPRSEKQVFHGRRNTHYNRGRGQGRGGRGGRGGGDASQANNRKPANHLKPLKLRGGAAFCKSRDIPKGDPKRWQTDWTGNDHAQKDTVFTWITAPRSHDTGGWTIYDPATNLAQPNQDWNFMQEFRQGQNEEQIQRWIDMMEDKALVDVTRAPNLDDLSVVDGFTYTFASPPKDAKAGVEYKTMGDIVPHYWVRDHFYGRVPLTTFFDQIIKADAPLPVDEEDHLDLRPWWERLVSGGSFLHPLAAPEIKGIDPDESIRETLSRECDYGSQQHAENTKRRELVKQGITLERAMRRAKACEKRQVAQYADCVWEPDFLKPIRDRKLAGIYLRHAVSDDMEAVCNILNYYVEHTTSVSETERPTVMELREQFKKITQQSKLPFLVACEKGALLRAKYSRNGDLLLDPRQLPDTIVGFGRAVDYGNGDEMYRFTAVLEIFIRQTHVLRRIGTCLMDKMLGLLDPDHIERGGYEVGDDNLEGARPVRNIKNIVVDYLYSTDRPERLESMRRRLVQGYQFEEVGKLRDIGRKLDRSVSKAVFMRTTGAVLDHTDPPEVTYSVWP